MPYRYSCPQGHTWEPFTAGRSPGSVVEPICPDCGATGTPGLAPDTASGPTKPGPPNDAAEASKHPAIIPHPDIPGYEILGLLGHGGMGVVYQARQRGLNRVVALKMILGGAHASPLQLARFQIEAETIASLQHPNIVQIHEIGRHEGSPYFSMEFVDGGGLDSHMAWGPQPARACAAVVERLARAMHTAHLRGIVHRDLKPANVLLALSDAQHGVPLAEPKGDMAYFEPKITDFGLAKRLGAEDSSVTRTGAILGTANYMAPEQAYGKTKEISPLTDVYALGAILYEMMTGRPPFTAESATDIVLMVRGEEPAAPSHVVAMLAGPASPQVPFDLETICLKCLNKDPKKRYATADALADDLHRFLAGEPVLARPASVLERSVKWVRRRPAMAGMVAVCAAAAVVLAVGVLMADLRVRAEKDIAVAAKQREEDERKRAEESLKQALMAVDTMLTEVAQHELAQEPHMQEKQRVLLEKALKYYQSFLVEHGDKEKVRVEAAKAYHNVGDIHCLLGHPDEALSMYGSAIALLICLVQERPNEHEFARRLADSYNFRGEVQRGASRMAQALDDYASTLELLEVLRKRFPDEPTFRRDLARTHANRGIVFQRTSRSEEAEAEFGYAIRHLRELVSRFPGECTYRQLLARCLLNIDPSPGTAVQLTRAAMGYEEAISLLGTLTSQLPKQRDYRHELGVAYNNLGNNLRRQDRPTEAMVAHQHAVTLFQQLAEQHPSVPEYRRELANSHNSLGIVFGNAEQGALAAQEWTQSAKLFAALATEYPALLEYRGDLGMALGNLGRLALLRGASDEARPLLQDGIEHLEAALKPNPEHPDYRATLRRQYRDLARVLKSAGESDAATRAENAAKRLGSR